jgi:hypothetical protein
MARPLRISFPGAFYHITSRGNEQKVVFKSIPDREMIDVNYFFCQRQLKFPDYHYCDKSPID